MMFSTDEPLKKSYDITSHGYISEIQLNDGVDP